MNQNFPMISVIILNYNGKNFLMDCLTSVLKSNYPNFEIILVDNASTDDSIKIVEETLGCSALLKIIKNDANLGFAAGNNLGAGYSKGKYVLFLNNDTLVEPNWIIELVNVLESDAKIGAAQSKLISFSDKRTIDSAGDFVDYYGLSFRKGSWGVNEGEYDRIEEIFSARGAALIVKSQIFAAIGGFDSDFFFCYEDIDLCWRIRINGYKIFFVPKSRVYHIGSASSISSSKNVFHIEKNRLFTLAKNMPLSYLAKYNPLTFTAGEILGDLMFKRPTLLTARLRSIFWILKNFKEIWCKRLFIKKYIMKIDYKLVTEYMLKTSSKLLLLLFLVQMRNGENQAIEYYYNSCLKNKSTA
jgi:GT2 family glycosyltransferase